MVQFIRVSKGCLCIAMALLMAGFTAYPAMAATEIPSNGDYVTSEVVPVVQPQSSEVEHADNAQNSENNQGSLDNTEKEGSSEVVDAPVLGSDRQANESDSIANGQPTSENNAVNTEAEPTWGTVIFHKGSLPDDDLDPFRDETETVVFTSGDEVLGTRSVPESAEGTRLQFSHDVRYFLGWATSFSPIEGWDSARTVYWSDTPIKEVFPNGFTGTKHLYRVSDYSALRANLQVFKSLILQLSLGGRLRHGLLRLIPAAP